MKKQCVYTYIDTSYQTVYRTSCGQHEAFGDAECIGWSIDKPKWKVCPHCGKRIVIANFPKY